LSHDDESRLPDR